MQLTLVQKTCLGLLGTLVLGVGTSGTALVSALRTERAYRAVITDNLGQARAISDLELALVERHARTFAWELSGSAPTPEELAIADWSVEAGLRRLRAVGLEPDQLGFLGPIGEGFREYQFKHAELRAELDTAGGGEGLPALWRDLNAQYDRVRQLCDQLDAANNRDIERAVAAQHGQTQRVTAWVSVCIVLSILLIAGLSWFLLVGLVMPLRRLTRDLCMYARPETLPDRPDELRVLGACFEHLKSDVVRTRDCLAQNTKRLLDAEKLATVGRLAAGVAHEIRSPLTSLKLRLFSMQKDLWNDPALEEDARVMSDEITRLDKIVRNFLEFARPPEVRTQRCDIALLLDKTLELLRYKLESARVRLAREEPSRLPPALADPHQLRQVFLNVLNNGIEALPPGGEIRVKVTVEAQTEGPGMVVVRVHDNGPGIPAELRGRVFDPFFSTKEDGAGLGLWIAQRIMIQHAGALELEESPGSGTVFAVWIPVAQVADDEPDTGGGRRHERSQGVRATAG